jgi:hypothetical protein
MASIEHHFTIEAKFPDEVIETEQVNGTIVIQNESNETAPSFQVVPSLCWSTIEVRVEHTIDIPELPPKTIFEYDFIQAALASGYMGVYLGSSTFTRNNHKMKFHKVGGDSLPGNHWFGSTRVKSISETLQEKHIETLVRSIESQDKLVKSQTLLAIAGIFFAFIQVVLMLI